MLQSNLMLGERLISAEEEQIFTDWLKRKGVKAALFDYDGTLIDTSSFIHNQRDKFLCLAQQKISNCDKQELSLIFENLDTLAYHNMGVSFSRWSYIVSEIGKTYDIDLLEEGLPFFQYIYENAPEVFEGTIDILDLCKKAGLKLGLVTHATQSWTDIKLEKNNLRDYFNHIEVIDIETHKYKEAKHWQQAINTIGVNPVEALVIGDNLKGDILAAQEIGVQNLVWISSKWSMYNLGEKTDNILEVEGIGKVIKAICQKG